jgi:hypothetical protein
MQEYRVQWCEQPFNYNAPRVLFVEANNPEDARVIARDYVERRFNIVRFSITDVDITSTLPIGTVRE